MIYLLVKRDRGEGAVREREEKAEFSWSLVGCFLWNDYFRSIFKAEKGGNAKL